MHICILLRSNFRTFYMYRFVSQNCFLSLIHIYICMYLFIHIYVYTRPCEEVSIERFIYIFLYVYIHLCLYRFVYIPPQSLQSILYIYIPIAKVCFKALCIYMYIYVYTYIYIYIHMYIYIYIHIIHTYIHAYL
jgi:hypothetical protein